MSVAKVNKKFGTAAYQQALRIIESDGGYFVDVEGRNENGLIIKDFRPIWEKEQREKETGQISNLMQNKNYPFTPFWLIPHDQFALFLDLNNLIQTGQDYTDFIKDPTNEGQLHGFANEFLIADTCNTICPPVVSPLFPEQIAQAA